MAPRDVILVVFPDLQGLDLMGPAEVFAAANQEVGQPAYRIRLAAVAPGPLRTTSGVTVMADEAIAEVAGPVDTLMVVGGDGTYGAVADAAPREPRGSPRTRCPPRHERLLGRLRPRPGRPARRPPRHHALARLRPARPGLPVGGRRP